MGYFGKENPIGLVDDTLQRITMVMEPAGSIQRKVDLLLSSQVGAFPPRSFRWLCSWIRFCMYCLLCVSMDWLMIAWIYIISKPLCVPVHILMLLFVTRFVSGVAHLLPYLELLVTQIDWTSNLNKTLVGLFTYYPIEIIKIITFVLTTSHLSLGYVLEPALLIIKYRIHDILSFVVFGSVFAIDMLNFNVNVDKAWRLSRFWGHIIYLLMMNYQQVGPLSSNVQLRRNLVIIAFLVGSTVARYCVSWTKKRPFALGSPQMELYYH